MPVSPKFINAPLDVPAEAIEGLLYMRPDLTILPEAPNVVVRRAITPGRVAIICGGGSGHEPAHASFVAEGWLSAAVCGGVFASPSQGSVLRAIRHCSRANGNAGVLLLIKNYSGDVINFMSAATVAATEPVGDAGDLISVRAVVIGDDVAFGADHDAQRGIAGTVLLYKMLGAAADGGASLEELVALCDAVAPNLRSLGASLSSCALPGSAPTSTLADGSVELGLGIHGESGKEARPHEAIDRLAVRMLQHIASPPVSDHESASGDAARSRSWRGDAAHGHVLFVNNLGATSDIEMQIVVRAVMRTARADGLQFAVQRLVVGRAMTALDMHGISVTVLRLPRAREATEWLGYLDAVDPPQVGAFMVCVPASEVPDAKATPSAQRWSIPPVASVDDARSAVETVRIVRAIARRLLDDEAMLNALDAAVGDGDLGTGTARAATAVLGLIADLEATGVLHPDPAALLGAVGEVVADAFGGTSGPLLGGFLAAAAPHLRGTRTGATVYAAFTDGTDAVQRIGKAARGDRTMVDALLPATEAAAMALGATAIDVAMLRSIRDAAAEGAARATGLAARRGRARSLAAQQVAGQPDPGCELIVLLLTYLVEEVAAAAT